MPRSPLVHAAACLRGQAMTLIISSLSLAVAILCSIALLRYSSANAKLTALLSEQAAGFMATPVPSDTSKVCLLDLIRYHCWVYREEPALLAVLPMRLHSGCTEARAGPQQGSLQQPGHLVRGAAGLLLLCMRKRAHMRRGGAGGRLHAGCVVRHTRHVWCA